MSAVRRSASWRTFIPLSILALTAASCAGSDESTASQSPPDSAETVTLRIGAIPDQEPERLQRTYELLSDYLEAELGDVAPGIEVEYVPVTEYDSAVTGFAVGDLDTVWFGALTGIQARIAVDGANAIVQRDIDAAFTSVFIARADSGIEPVTDVEGLSALAGRSITFGSESSTSGRLMPQAFLEEAGLDIDADFAGSPGFSGSHDATLEVVVAGTFEVGAINSELWDDRVAEGVPGADELIEVFRTPTYPNYHWVAQPDLDERFGDGFTDDFVDALSSLDADDADDAEILDLFGAGAFITTQNENYDAMESTARDAELIR
ncbi:MAG: putative selenate ABC transporter substrate-binding protein [Ilumatobacter sp.]